MSIILTYHIILSVVLPNLCFTAQFNEKTFVENAKTAIPSTVITKLSTALNISASSTKMENIQNSINTLKTDIESMKSDFKSLVIASSGLSTSALATANDAINTLTLISSILNKINKIAIATSTSYTIVDLIDSVKTNVMYELFILYNVMEINPIMKIRCAAFMDNKLDIEFNALTKTLSGCLTTIQMVNQNIATKVADFSNLIWATKMSISGCRMMTILCSITVIIDTVQVNVKKIYNDVVILMTGLSQREGDSFDSDIATCGSVVLANRVEAIRNITMNVYSCVNT